MRPTGLRLLFWIIWGAWFNFKIKMALKSIERRHGSLAHAHEIVAKTTEQMLNEEAKKLHDSGAIEDDRVFWNGSWFTCDIEGEK